VDIPLDKRLVAVFGSATRLLALATLASSEVPLTAYRVAKTAGVPRTRVYKELRRLARAGVVEASKGGSGEEVWTLLDPEVRQLLQRRARLTSGWALVASAPGLHARSARILAAYRRHPIDPKKLDGDYRPRRPHEFARDPEKDDILTRIGLRPSGRARRRS
jgi:DNA-binding transcriptional ArsR family regulator